MMVYRSLVLGLLGAIALLVASRPPATPAEAAAPVPVMVVADDGPRESASVVDVSRELARHDVLPLLGLAPGERIVGIDGLAASTADLVTRWRYCIAGSYLDLAVRGPGGDERRILVLAHP